MVIQIRLTRVLEAVVLGVVGDPFAIGSLGPGLGTDAERQSGDDSRELHFRKYNEWIGSAIGVFGWEELNEGELMQAHMESGVFRQVIYSCLLGCCTVRDHEGFQCH